MIEVESKGDSLAYNPIEQAYGIMQIRPVRLLDYNLRTGSSYKMRDCYSPEVSKKIFMYYAVKHNPDEILAICRDWNGASEKNKYYQKVKAKL